jgi:polygalacturonase
MLPYSVLTRSSVVCLLAMATAFGASVTTELPRWTAEAGARHARGSERTYAVTGYGAVADGKTVATTSIQAAIDAAAKAGGGVVTFAPGTYLTGALFVKSHVHLRIDAGVTLLGVADEAAYPRRPTRVAGIEMTWPSALLNVDEAEDAMISGGGTVDGNGEWCWQKFWTMRKQEYEPRGLRWAADYDAERVRLCVVSNSKNITLQGLHLRRSGFWTVQVVYSEYVTVDGLRITDNQGPSTDGIDIDSSRYVVVEHCDIDNNDDDICLKSGRDADGMRVNRPTEYVVVRDNVTRRGGGILSFGSEVGGGIRHIVAYRNKGIGTSEGLRFKSARTRGGYIDDVLILDTTMENVERPFTFTLNWNPAYSHVTLPKDTTNLPPRLGGKMPDYWKVLAAPVEAARGISDFGHITIRGVDIVGAKQVFSASGMAEKPIHDVRFEHVAARAQKSGSIEFARDWQMDDVRVVTPTGEPVRIVHGERVQSPQVEAGAAEKAPASP